MIDKIAVEFKITKAFRKSVRAMVVQIIWSVMEDEVKVETPDSLFTEKGLAKLVPNLNELVEKETDAAFQRVQKVLQQDLADNAEDEIGSLDFYDNLYDSTIIQRIVKKALSSAGYKAAVKDVEKEHDREVIAVLRSQAKRLGYKMVKA